MKSDDTSQKENRIKTAKPGRHTAKIKNLVDRVLDGPGQFDPQMRRSVAQKVAAHAGALSKDDVQLPPEINSYVDKIALHAYRVTDADIEALRAAGYSEDVIFEMTVSAALGAGMARLKSGLTALRGGEDAA
jgi:alkylhydroperoxidase family enzyme